MNPMPKPTTPNTPLTRRALLHTGAGICATAAGAVLLSACSSSDDSLAKQANSGDNKGYIAGDGSVTEYQEAERGDPVAFTGELFDGKTVTAESLRGKPVLLNFWYAGCAPCRAEAPDLQKLSEEFKDKIAFYGVNVRDEKNTAEAFERSFNVTYPSFKDVTGKVLLFPRGEHQLDRARWLAVAVDTACRARGVYFFCFPVRAAAGSGVFRICCGADRGEYTGNGRITS